VYPRPEGEVYVTGYPDGPVVVKETPGQEEVRAEVTDRLEGAMKLVSSELGSAEVGVNCKLCTNHRASTIVHQPSCINPRPSPIL
jgi:hypothetical protein